MSLSATMLWNHPTIVALAGHLAKKVLPQTESDASSTRWAIRTAAS